MQEIESRLSAGRELAESDVRTAAAFLLDPGQTPDRKAAFLRALARKGETTAEIAAFVEEFLRRAVDPAIDASELPGPVLDVVGTGGDRLDLFNVSTTSIFILAAGGVCIVKHGNRAITGRSGGADVLEALGARIDLKPPELARCIRETGIGFIFAPLYHPAFKAVAEARGILAAEGQRSIFNLLGPLLNPARPAHQLVGVSERKLVPAFAEILLRLGRKSAWVAHGVTDDGRGMDELSTLGPNHVARIAGDRVETFEADPAALGFPPARVEDLAGGDARRNAGILRAILDGSERGPRRDLAVLNAAAGFVIVGMAPDLAGGVGIVARLLDEGAALAKLEEFMGWH